MNKIKFIFKRILDMDFKAVFKTVSRMHKKSGKNSIALFCDVIWCGFKYGAGYRDYEYFEFYTLNAQQRATYLVRTVNNLITAHCNQKDHYHWLHDKVDFNKRYNDYVKRDWIDFRSASKDDFMRFIDGKKAIIVKPVDATCGEGIKKFNVADYETYDALYDELKASKGIDLIEDYIVQHSELSRVYPYSVNTCRVTTLLIGDEVHIIATALRIGNNASVVDNISSGGMSAPINTQTGAVILAAYDKSGNEFKEHPMTGESIKGFVIPYWDEIVKMCKAAALVTPEVRYSGWDVAVAEDGPQLIEGNHLPGYSVIQTPPSHQEVKTYGLLPMMRELLKDEFKI